jgi:Flp pilus assembly protein TadG
MGMMAKLLARLRAFGADRRANVAMIYAVALVPVILGACGGLDYARGIMVRASLTQSLDAAGLAVGSSGTLTTDQTKAMAQAFFNANYHLDSSYGTPTPVTVTQNGQDFTLSASVTMPTILLHIIGIDTMPVGSTVVITRNSKNIEVAMALDITGSMKGSRLTDLKAAAKGLIDTVVQDQQSPTYTKVAIAPYSMAVNVGSAAVDVRGAITPGVAITGATKANPVVITAPGHGFVNGDIVYITGVSGMTALNNKLYTVANRTTDSFTLKNVDGTGYSKYTSGGTIWCTKPGCQYYYFRSDYGTYNNYQVSTCVTERTTDAYNDTAPSTTPLGRNYPDAGNDCLSSTITPLSSNKTSLKSAIDGYVAEGSTAGHIGTAWAWYLLSPNFGALWPAASKPGVYGDQNILKVAVLMTDGAYNTPYCNGVIAADAGSGSGGNDTHNSCDAPNGSSIYQASSFVPG